ncbi:MAG: hypothetical protein K2N86_03520 [Rikenellaceae bacterium]|nr:hypothetical protein [Rikenellaceae bacterium]MDE7355514.1 hypothetical protein [Rikenellaceae bacterium]
METTAIANPTIEATSSSEQQYGAITAISRNTRDYLALVGKLSDVHNEFYRLTARDFGNAMADKLSEQFIEHFYNAKEMILTQLKEVIYDNLSDGII